MKGMFSLGDWKWKDDIHFTMYDEANNPIGTYDAYLKDVHVGNSAQLTSALSASWEPFKGFKISATITSSARTMQTSILRTG